MSAATIGKTQRTVARGGLECEQTLTNEILAEMSVNIKAENYWCKRTQVPRSCRRAVLVTPRSKHDHLQTKLHLSIEFLLYKRSGSGAGDGNRTHTGRRQLQIPVATIILAGLEPSSLVHHHAV
jgi:hypothetical protein